jgi:predicted 3-demethylubiquinone-9 3-methyltransferase (glyoxalase superfamily)
MTDTIIFVFSSKASSSFQTWTDILNDVQIGFLCRQVAKNFDTRSILVLSERFTCTTGNINFLIYNVHLSKY